MVTEAVTTGILGAIVILALFLASIAVVVYVAFKASKAVIRSLRAQPVPTKREETVARPDTPRPLPAEQIEARLRWDWHEKQGIVYQAGLMGDVATIIVHEEPFLALDPAAQAQYAETLNMASLGPGRSMPEYLFIGYNSNKPIARWTRSGVSLL